MIDKSFFMVYDMLQKMETIRNPKGLYWNYFYHVWQVLSASRFANAVAFVSGTVPAVTQVIVDPTIATVKAGDTFELTAYVRATDGQDHDVTWKVEGSTSGTSLASGTAISEDGVLTVGAAQTGELKVTATVTLEGSTQVKGESIITIV